MSLTLEERWIPDARSADSDTRTKESRGDRRALDPKWPRVTYRSSARASVSTHPPPDGVTDHAGCDDRTDTSLLPHTSPTPRPMWTAAAEPPLATSASRARFLGGEYGRSTMVSRTREDEIWREVEEGGKGNLDRGTASTAGTAARAKQGSTLRQGWCIVCRCRLAHVILAQGQGGSSQERRKSIDTFRTNPLAQMEGYCLPAPGESVAYTTRAFKLPTCVLGFPERW